MITGELSLEDTAPVFLSENYSAGNLFFCRLGEERLSIMSPFESPTANRCTACGTLIVTGLSGTHTACLACGVMMAPNVIVCPKCGWTYETGNAK